MRSTRGDTHWQPRSSTRQLRLEQSVPRARLTELTAARTGCSGKNSTLRSRHCPSSRRRSRFRHTDRSRRCTTYPASRSCSCICPLGRTFRDTCRARDNPSQRCSAVGFHRLHRSHRMACLLLHPTVLRHLRALLHPTRHLPKALHHSPHHRFHPTEIRRFRRSRHHRSMRRARRRPSSWARPASSHRKKRGRRIRRARARSHSSRRCEKLRAVRPSPSRVCVPEYAGQSRTLLQDGERLEDIESPLAFDPAHFEAPPRRRYLVVGRAIRRSPEQGDDGVGPARDEIGQTLR